MTADVGDGLRESAAVDPEGFFGPRSVAWRVLSAPATALMIAQITNLLEVPHSDFQAVLMGHDPLFPTNSKRQRGAGTAPDSKSGHFHDRLRRTVVVPLPILFGDKQTATLAARKLFNYHRPMAGSRPGDGAPYSATAAQSMLFASVTIAHAGLIAYEKYALTDRRRPGRLTADERDQYFREMAQLPLLMGVPSQDIPRSSAEVDRYYRSLSSKMTYLPGWRRAQRRTGSALLRPDNATDIRSTLADIALMISAVPAYAVLPTPSRRLHGIGSWADPVLKLVYVSSLPLFALLRMRGVRRAALAWYVGSHDAAVLEKAACRARQRAVTIADPVA